jgi:hypothetical protein
MQRQFSINAGGFVIKGGSESINWKEKRYRLKRNDEMAVRQKNRYGTGPKIQPNIAGVQQDSWSDCQKLAKESGMNAESFQPWVDKEKKPKIQVATH